MGVVVEPLVLKVTKVSQDKLVQLADQVRKERMGCKDLREIVEQQDCLGQREDQATRVIWGGQDQWDWLVKSDKKEHQEPLGQLDHLEEGETREHLVPLDQEVHQELRVPQELREMLAPWVLEAVQAGRVDKEGQESEEVWVKQEHRATKEKLVTGEQKEEQVKGVPKVLQVLMVCQEPKVTREM